MSARAWAWPAGVLLAATLVHWWASPYGEPWKNNDETRHVMTGVFFHDAYRDAHFGAGGSLADPKGYAVRYYAQYPALGLLVWPPLFYALEGAAMLALGPTYGAARLLLTAFAVAVLALTWKLFALVKLPREWAAAGLALFALSPMIVDTSRYVLLELPTLAWVLAAVVCFESYFDRRRGWLAVAACLAAAAAALTRFDGVVLLPYFLLRLALTRQLAVLLRRPVLVGIVLALALAGPYYWLTLQQYQTGLATAATAGTSDESTGFFAPRNVVLYLAFIPDQVGWAVTLLAWAGALRAGRAWRRGEASAEARAVGVFGTLFLATFVTFAPLAEPEARHAIYWVPALAGFAALGAKAACEWCGRAAGCGVVVAAIVATGCEATRHPGWSVEGYREAAEYVVAERTTERPVLFEGVLGGNFVFQVRAADPERRLRVVRGDKLIYAVLSDPHAGYVEYALTVEDVLKRLEEADPEFVVFEYPQLFELDLPAADQLRRAVKSRPDLYRPERGVAFTTNHGEFSVGRLEIYRKLTRNPHPRDAAIPVLGLGRSLPGG